MMGNNVEKFGIFTIVKMSDFKKDIFLEELSKIGTRKDADLYKLVCKTIELTNLQLTYIGTCTRLMMMGKK